MLKEKTRLIEELEKEKQVNEIMYSELIQNEKYMSEEVEEWKSRCQVISIEHEEAIQELYQENQTLKSQNE